MEFGCPSAYAASKAAWRGWIACAADWTRGRHLHDDRIVYCPSKSVAKGRAGYVIETVRSSITTATGLYLFTRIKGIKVSADITAGARAAGRAGIRDVNHVGGQAAGSSQVRKIIDLVNVRLGKQGRW